jgi:hypothetical protein
MRRVLLAAVLGLMVGATGPADAGVIFTYSMDTNFCDNGPGLLCAAVKGSFSVDSANFNATDITIIDSFITDLSFTVTLSSRISLPPNLPPVTTFDPSVGFLPFGVTVTPAGVLTNGSEFNFIETPPSNNFFLVWTSQQGANRMFPLAGSAVTANLISRFLAMATG